VAAGSTAAGSRGGWSCCVGRTMGRHYREAGDGLHDGMVAAE
jgi:hypothetical protein